MSSELSLWQLFLHASLLVKLIMVGLLALSVISWSIIIQRYRELKLVQENMTKFEEQFWSGADLNKLYERQAARERSVHGLASVFTAGFKEFSRLSRQPGLSPNVLLEGSERSMNIALTKECDKLESSLSFLATVGSVSPYIGLFGTVWGIMHAIIALGNVEHATLSMVAPGIAEALVATALGLFVAIPAYIAYNRLGNLVETIQNRFVTFQEEFTSILHRQAHTQGS